MRQKQKLHVGVRLLEEIQLQLDRQLMLLDKNRKKLRIGKPQS